MKRHLLSIALVATLFTLTGCAALFGSIDKQLLVQPGMSQEELVKKCGSPEYRRFNQNSEEWEYVLLRSEQRVVRMVVRFEGGRVTSMNTFEDYPTPSPLPTPVQK